MSFEYRSFLSGYHFFNKYFISRGRGNRTFYFYRYFYVCSSNNNSHKCDYRNAKFYYPLPVFINILACCFCLWLQVSWEYYYSKMQAELGQTQVYGILQVIPVINRTPSVKNYEHIPQKAVPTTCCQQFRKTGISKKGSMRPFGDRFTSNHP